MRRQGKKHILIRIENIIQQFPQSPIPMFIRLTNLGIPKFIFLRKARLEPVPWKIRFDSRLC
jgi:hypothetical protein